MPVIQNGLWSSFLLTACLMLFSYHPLCIWCLPVVQQWGRKTDTMIVSAVQLILFCIIMDRAAVNKSPLVLLGSDGRLPVWLRDGVIADLVATPSDIPYLLSREESQPLMFTDNCIDGPFFQSLVLLVHASENTLTVNVKQRRYLMRNLSWLVSLSVWNQTRDTQHIIAFLSTRTSWNMLSVLCVSTLTVWGGFATEADGIIPSDQNRRMLLKTYWKNFLNALLPYIVRNVSISWVAQPCVF